MFAESRALTPTPPPTPVLAPRHQPVLLEEVLSFVPAAARFAVDATAGRGGHSGAILARFDSLELLACDRDPDAVAATRDALAPFGGRTMVKQLSFSELPHHVVAGSVDFLLADLGVSSPQLEEPGRGFSFTHDGPLDMRMDPGAAAPTAADLVNKSPPSDLLAMLRELGEEPFAPRIIKKIIEARQDGPILRTGRLAAIVADAIPRKFHRRGYHPATQTFQALRMRVNNELGELESFLDGALNLLAPGGRVAVIAFHSLEDRRVKEAFRAWEQPCICPPDLPRCACGRVPVGARLTRKAVKAGLEELGRNPRSRSARLRVFEKQ